MIKKLSLNKIRPFIGALVLCLIIGQSCKKDIIQPNAAKNAISIKEAKEWYLSIGPNKAKTLGTNKISAVTNNDNDGSLSLLWSLATENIAKNNNSIVAIPLNKSRKLAFGKYGFRKLLVYKNDRDEIEGEIMEVIFDEKDVRERKYLELYEMDKFNGKVILFDMNMKFKTGFTYKMGRIDKTISLDLNGGNGNVAIKPKENLTTGGAAGTGNNKSGQLAASKSASASTYLTCYSEYINPMEGIIWPGCDCSDEGYWVTYCSFSFDIDPWVIDFIQAPAPSEGGGSNDPVPVMPPLYGFYGTLPDPCNVDSNSPISVICEEQISALVKEINELNMILGLTPLQQEWLLAHPDMVPVIKNYFNTNGGATLDNVLFVQWAVGYLKANPDVSFLDLAEINTIPNASIILPNLDVSELNNYPKFKALVEDLPNFLNRYSNILDALSYTTGFSKKKIKELMQPGKGPKVIVVNNLKDSYGDDIFGQFNSSTKSLLIDDGYVNGLDVVNSPVRYQAIGLMLTIATLHEFVHFGRNANELSSLIGDKKGIGREAGWYFEDAIVPPGNLERIQPENAMEWLRFYKTRPKN